MLRVVKKCSTKAEADAHMEPARKWRADASKNGYHGGCVGELPCEKCHSIISHSICLCSGRFDCPVCGFKNEGFIKWIVPPLEQIMGVVKYETVNQEAIDAVFGKRDQIEYYI